jgi:glutamate synthase (NADPH/NADH) small chain
VKINLQNNKTPMPTLAAGARKNFDEVSLGYDEAAAQNEAARCLGCKDRPCVGGCPLSVQIPDFIALIKEGKYAEAYQKDREQNTLSAMCGRVCPQELQCESRCVRGKTGEPVAIGRLERFISDRFLEARELTKSKPAPVAPPISNGFSVAVVGSGPSGLSCASDLVERGYDVTIFEAKDVAGGVPVYGIPRFVLPRQIVDAEIRRLTDMGVKIKTNITVGKDTSVFELKKNFDAVFIGTGTGKPKYMGIAGEQLKGLYNAGDYLYKINLKRFAVGDQIIKSAKKAAVIGGGNVALDAARCALRMGADEVSVLYRRGKSEMPSRLEEIGRCEEEGVKFLLLSKPVRFVGADGALTGAQCVKMRLLDKTDKRGKKISEEIADSNFFVDCDLAIMAIGYEPDTIISGGGNGGGVGDGYIEGGIKGGGKSNAGIAAAPKLITDDDGLIKVDKNYMTSMDGVFAGGDAVTGSATVILAMSAGKNAAVRIDEYIKIRKR